MKKYFIYLMLLFCVQQVSARTFYKQLCQFNFNWKKYAHVAPAGEARQFGTDADYVQAHLSAVLPILRNNPTDHLKPYQRQTRLQLIEVLDNYRAAGNFPLNYYRKERIPVFIDEHGTHCAVGYLLQQTGHEDVAQRIAATDNYAWVKDIDDPALPLWQAASGFSLEELKLIQGAYFNYLPNARLMANRYEIPQKPEPVTLYFEDKYTGRSLEKSPEHIWCQGEGKNGVLNGRWEQNYGVGIPWIEGFFSYGERTGQWKEYYPGTRKLCRTENWRADKLNGVRKRFDRSGKLVEEIMFEEGEAICKTNYDLVDSLVWVRRPVDSTLMSTEVFTFGGRMLAKGVERVYNPGGLLWFQNIELTALNSMAITSREISQTGNFNQHFQRNNFQIDPPLVQYNKEGEWVFYREDWENMGKERLVSSQTMLKEDFSHMSPILYEVVKPFEDLKFKSGYSAIRVLYEGNLAMEIFGEGKKDFDHLSIRYHVASPTADLRNSKLLVRNLYRVPNANLQPTIKTLGQYNRSRKKIGVWKHYDETSALYKTETFILPREEEEEVSGLGMR